MDIPNPCPFLQMGERKKRGTLAQFLAKQLRLPQPLYRWQLRKLAYVRKRCGHRSGEAGLVCNSSSRNIQAQHRHLALAAQKTASPVALSHGNQGAVAILFSQSAIFNGKGAILCENTGGDSEHSTDPVTPPVTSSDRGYIKRIPSGESSMRELLLQRLDLPDLPDTQRSQQQRPSGTSHISPVQKEAIRWKNKTIG